MDSIYRRKYEGQTANGDTLIVSRNTEVLSDYAGAFIYSLAQQGNVIPVDQIDAVIEALKTIKDEYEALKPKNSDILDALPIGSVVVFNGEATAWFKSHDGNWSIVGRERGYYSQEGKTGDWFNIDNWTFVVKYNPDEEAN